LSADQEMVIGDKEQWLALSDHLPISYRLNVQKS
jgi:endonuclease/exonuclease/phosphatase family metal-dependent hydrolase